MANNPIARRDFVRKLGGGLFVPVWFDILCKSNAQLIRALPKPITAAASCGGGGGSPAHVQSTIQDAGSVTVATPATLAFGSNLAANCLVIVPVRIGSSTGTVTITDNNGGSYAQAIKTDDATNGASLAVYFAYNHAAGACTVSCAVSITETIRWAIHEYSLVCTTSPLDVTVGAIGTSTAPSSGATAATTQAKELVFCAVACNTGGNTFTAGSGYTLRQQIPSGQSKLGTEDKTVTSTGAQTGTATLGGSDNWIAAVCTFKGT